MTTPQFVAALGDYLTQAMQARDEDRHHDFRRQLFVSFLNRAFGIEQSDVNVEHYIQLAGRQVAVTGTARIRKGWIDAIFRDIIFEFKRDLNVERAEGLRELRDYLTSLPNGGECVGLLTDGLQFIAYVLDSEQPTGLRQTDVINLETAQATDAYLWFDAYLLRQRGIAPTSSDIVHRFGLSSPTFVVAGRALRASQRTFAATEAGAFEVKRQQWAFHLARVYGTSDVTTDELFVRHTYLCQFAKLLAYTAQFGIAQAMQEIEGIIDGKAFQDLGVDNIGEQDFFAWVLAPEVRAETLDVFRHIIQSFAVYDLRRIDQDLLKQLYQNLVDPDTRHELGEYYTPDWLAEVTLREVAYGPGRSLLDPACGSGTFLFTALRLLAERGLTGQALVDFALDNIMGVDVHPLAVTIAKLNYMLAILPHLRGGNERKLRSIPVAMANSLQEPSKAYRISTIPVSFGPGESELFQIPATAAQNPNELLKVLADMGEMARRSVEVGNDSGFAGWGAKAVEQLPVESGGFDSETARMLWTNNVRNLARQTAVGRDSIWVYLLQNVSRPLYLRHRKFQVVVGNPPWLSYRYVQDRAYQRDVKELTRVYGLLASQEVKLFTQMELATLFFEHCWNAYLALDGTIAFVMPRSVLTGAKQHQAFQQHGFSRVLDLKAVAPLFHTESCVLIRKRESLVTHDIPTRWFSGELPAQECSLAQASQYLSHRETVTNFSEQSEIASPYYYPRFRQGATLVPRTLVFVTSAQPDLRPGELAHSPIMQTDPDVEPEAKEPWKGLRLKGYIDEGFLYATFLSKNLMPFGVRKLHLVALPIRVGRASHLADMSAKAPPERFIPMSLAAMRDAYSLPGVQNPESKARTADDWFATAEQMWGKYRKSDTMDLWDRLNYQQGVVVQRPAGGFYVVYNGSGSNISSAVVNASIKTVIGGARPPHVVIDSTTYWFRADSAGEAHFLAALLNAPCVDAAIKAYQTRGIYVGPRHIHRRPFEVCPIPPYVAADANHQQLALLSQQAHEVVAGLDLSLGGVVSARKRARYAVATYIEQIDAIAQRLLNLAPAIPATPGVEEGDEADDGLVEEDV